MYHCHSDYSLLDSCTKYQDYVDLAVKNGQKALSISEHGKPLNWTEKWAACKAAGIKYIHSVEIYMTESLDEKVRDNYHTVLMARNKAGLLELNELITKSCDSDHFYYVNRITFDEFLSMSKNIISTSACLASPLNRLPLDHPRYMELVQKYDFLEIQPHNHPDQKAFNQRLLKLSKETGKPLIAGTDTHSSSKYKAECRSIFLKAKHKSYGDEDLFDLSYKTYDELVEMFRVQNAIPEEEYMKAIENTKLLEDMTEEIELDTSIKYPILYGTSEADEEKYEALVWQRLDEKLEAGIIPREEEQGFRDSIKEELRVFKKLHMSGFMLSMAELVTWCREKGFAIGPSRGSVGGSRAAYVTNVTDLDSEAWNTTFSRFANEDRVEINRYVTYQPVSAYIKCAIMNLLNCWNTLKTYVPQRDDEICMSVMVAKAERNICIVHGQILNMIKWAISSQALNRGRFGGYPAREYTLSEVEVTSTYKTGDDIAHPLGNRMIITQRGESFSGTGTRFNRTTIW